MLQLRSLWTPEEETGVDSAALATAAGLVGAVAGFLGLLGWTLGWEPLKSIIPGMVSMKPNTALGLLAAGYGVVLSARRPQGNRLAALAFAALTLALGAATLTEYIAGIDLGIDQLLFHDARADVFAGRMAPVTAAMLILLGGAIVLIHRKRGVLWGQALACAAGLLAITNVVGIAYGVRNVFAIGLAKHIGMAAPTSAGSLLLSCGTLLLQPRRGFMARLTSRGPGGVMARAMLPVVLAAPVVVGWLRWQGQVLRWYDTNFGLTLYTSANIVVFAFLVLITAGVIDRFDQERSRVEARLRESQSQLKLLNEDLEGRVRERTSDLERANHELARARGQLQSVLDAATNVSIIATGTDGIIRLFNSGAEKMLGYHASEMIGIQTPEVLHDRAESMDRGAALSEMRGRPVEGFEVYVAEAREGASDPREWTYVRKDGSTLDVRLAMTSLYGPSGALEGFLGIATDITLLKAMERELRRQNESLAEQTRRAEVANKAKSEFLASMSHEIRTPMNSIIGMADLLWDTELSTEQRHYVEVFRRAGSSLLALISDILDVSKIEAGHMEFEQVPFDLEQVIQDTVELIGPKARSKGIALLCRLAPDVPVSLVGDPVRTRQVLINLLGNAVKFTETGEVLLTVSNNQCGIPGHIRFSVSDTGIGIPADKLSTICDAFTQADSSTTRKYGGTGLGLAISLRIIERMGGRLTVESTPGKGSTFQFTAQFERAPESAAVLPAAANDLCGKRVLLVDDNATNRMIVRETLLIWGVETDEYETAQSALEALRRQPYALAILDNRMPGMNGFELAGRIRQLDGGPPVVMLTSDSDAGDVLKRRKAGVSGYAVKPVLRSELLRLVYGALSSTELPGAELPPAEAEPAKPEASLRILVAEDSADNRLLVAAYLDGGPHSVSFVENGAEAVQAFRNGAFDLILMDMRMPVMDGLDATRAVRALERNEGRPEIPIIALTANARPQDVETSREAGCCAHLSKPISRAKLLKAIAQYGNRAQSQARAALAAEVPDELEELIPGYLAARRSEVPKMMSLLKASEFDGLWTLGHNMKGTGTSFGFPELTRLGAALESDAKERDASAAAAHIAEVDRYLTTAGKLN